MKNQKLTLILISIIVIISLTACSKSNETPEINYEQTKNELVNIIKNGTNSNVQFEIEQDDILDFDKYKSYYNNNAIYIQADTYMYRFQLDENYNVKSYVKYRLEG